MTPTGEPTSIPPTIGFMLTSNRAVWDRKHTSTPKPKKTTTAASVTKQETDSSSEEGLGSGDEAILAQREEDVITNRVKKKRRVATEQALAKIKEQGHGEGGGIEGGVMTCCSSCIHVYVYIYICVCMDGWICNMSVCIDLSGDSSSDSDTSSQDGGTKRGHHVKKGGGGLLAGAGLLGAAVSNRSTREVCVVGDPLKVDCYDGVGMSGCLYCPAHEAVFFLLYLLGGYVY